MNILIEALKELSEINEGWDVANLDAHYAWKPDKMVNTFTNKRGEEKSVHPHVATTLPILQQAFNMHYRYPLYFGLSEAQYAKAATELALSPSSNATDTSTRTGVESFLGTNKSAYPDCVYKIRYKSEFINKNYFIETLGSNDLGEAIWNAYVEEFGTSQFCDLVIYVNDKFARTDPKIKSFYPVTKEDVEYIISNCKVFDEESSVIAENNPNNKLIIIDSLSRGFGVGEVPGRGELKCCIASPTKIERKKRDNKNDDVDHRVAYREVAYKEGVLYDPVADKLYPFDVEKLQHEKDNTVKSSKTLAEAQKAFRKAALKVYAKLRDRTFRSDSTDRVPYFWANDFQEAKTILESSPDIEKKLYSWGLDAFEDYNLYESNINSMLRSIMRGFDKLDN